MLLRPLTPPVSFFPVKLVLMASQLEVFFSHFTTVAEMHNIIPWAGGAVATRSPPPSFLHARRGRVMRRLLAQGRQRIVRRRWGVVGSLLPPPSLPASFPRVRRRQGAWNGEIHPWEGESFSALAFGSLFQFASFLSCCQFAPSCSPKLAGFCSWGLPGSL